MIISIQIYIHHQNIKILINRILNNQIMQRVNRFFRNIYKDLSFKFKASYRGQGYAAFESLIAYKRKIKEREKVVLKYQQYTELNKYFLQFMNSAESNGRVNGDNLAFLIGSQNMGKTNYVQANIDRFKQLKSQYKDKSKKPIQPILHLFKSPEYVQNQIKQTIFQNEYYIVLNFNFKDKGCMNFSSFLREIHESIITEIINLNKKLDNKLITSQLIKEILTAQNSQEYLFIYMKDAIFCMLEDRDIIQIKSQENKKLLEEMNQEMINKRIQAKEFFNDEKYYSKLVKIIGQELKITETEAALRIFLSGAKRIEYEHRPAQYLNSWYESGIESTNILFDILNFMSGFGKLQKTIFENYFINKSLTPAHQNIIKNFTRVDIGMFLLNLDSLYFYGSAEYHNFIDHVISRTANMSGLRSHFPVMIQFSNYAEFQDVHDMGQFSYGNPVVIQLPGYSYMQFLLSTTNISEIFTPKILSNLFFRLGRNPETWNRAIIQIAKGNTNMKDVITGKSQYLKKQSIRVQAKINALFTHSEILPQLTDNSARFEIVQHLRLLKKGRGLLMLDRPGYYIDFYTRPIWRAMMRQNLVYIHYYGAYVDVCNLTDLIPLISIKNQLLKGRLWDFIKWRVENIDILRIYGRQTLTKVDTEKDSHDLKMIPKIRKEGQLRETYYGMNHNYMFHYKEKGVQIQLI